MTNNQDREGEGLTWFDGFGRPQDSNGTRDEYEAWRPTQPPASEGLVTDAGYRAGHLNELGSVLVDCAEFLAGDAFATSGWPEAKDLADRCEAVLSQVVAGDLALQAQPAADTQLEAYKAALEPFAAMGRVMEIRATVTFGKMPPDSEIVCESSGEAGMGILTMGHFRDAAALLPNAPGWGGMYRPIGVRNPSQEGQVE